MANSGEDDIDAVIQSPTTSLRVPAARALLRSGGMFYK